MSYFPKPSLNENDLAIIERGDIAAHSIEAGQYVSWHGKTGKAKAAILQGATLNDTLFDYDEDGVLNASLGANNLDTAIELTRAVEYTCPSDGYLRLTCDYGSSNYSYATITGSNGLNPNNFLTTGNNAAGGTSLLFVKKGMKFTFYGGAGGPKGYFIPLV